MSSDIEEWIEEFESSHRHGRLIVNAALLGLTVAFIGGAVAFIVGEALAIYWAVTKAS